VHSPCSGSQLVLGGSRKDDVQRVIFSDLTVGFVTGRTSGLVRTASVIPKCSGPI